MGIVVTFRFDVEPANGATDFRFDVKPTDPTAVPFLIGNM